MKVIEFEVVEYEFLISNEETKKSVELKNLVFPKHVYVVEEKDVVNNGEHAKLIRVNVNKENESKNYEDYFTMTIISEELLNVKIKSLNEEVKLKMKEIDDEDAVYLVESPN